MDNIFRELEIVVPRYRINFVGINDELFSYHRNRVLDFCRRFADLAKEVPLGNQVGMSNAGGSAG
jgi:hypothetical protein